MLHHQMDYELLYEEVAKMYTDYYYFRVVLNVSISILIAIEFWMKDLHLISHEQ